MTQQAAPAYQTTRATQNEERVTDKFVLPPEEWAWEDAEQHHARPKGGLPTVLATASRTRCDHTRARRTPSHPHPSRGPGRISPQQHLSTNNTGSHHNDKATGPRGNARVGARRAWGPLRRR